MLIDILENILDGDSGGKSGGDAAAPAENAYSAECIPAAGLFVSFFELEVNPAAMGVFEKPRSVGLLFGAQPLDGFFDARIGRVSRGAEVVEGAQYVVMPADG